jgi:hypothetical protein
LLFTACKERTITKEHYYENYTFGSSNPTSYLATKTIDKGNRRKQITYRYSDFAKEITKKEIDYFILTKNCMFVPKKADGTKSLYLSTKYVDSCIVWIPPVEPNDYFIDNSFAAKTHCFIGEKKIKLGENNYIETYEFYYKIGLAEDAPLHRIFYDKSFILVRMENVSGYTYFDSLIRINSIPLEFELLLNKEQEWTGLPN